MGDAIATGEAVIYKVKVILPSALINKLLENTPLHLFNCSLLIYLFAII